MGRNSQCHFVTAPSTLCEKHQGQGAGALVFFCSALQAESGCPGDSLARLRPRAGKSTWAGCPPREATDTSGALAIAFFSRASAGTARSSAACTRQGMYSMGGTCCRPQHQLAATLRPGPRRRAPCFRKARYSSLRPRWSGGLWQRNWPRHVEIDGAGPDTLTGMGLRCLTIIVLYVLSEFLSTYKYVNQP